MQNIGIKNKHHLINILKIKLEKYIESIPEKMIHNFSNKNPDLIVELRINHAEFEVAVLLEENAILKKKLERSMKRCEDLHEQEQ